MNLDACSLLSQEEVAAIQGETWQKTQPSEEADGPYAVSRCYITLPTFSRSISLVVIGPGKTGADARQYWAETFSSAVLEPRERADGKRYVPPEKVGG